MTLTYYGSDPWTNLDKNQRQWYDPLLQQIFRRNTVYADLVPYATQSMLDARTARMTITMTLDFHANFNTIGLRQLDGVPMQLDSKSVDIVFNRYGGVTNYHKYDPMITYWQSNGVSGLEAILKDKLARQQVEVMDTLTRNAFLSTSYVSLPQSSYTGCDQLTDTDTFNLDMVTDSILRAQTQNVLTSPVPQIAAGDLLFIDTPGQINQIQQSPQWLSYKQYKNSENDFNAYEVGSYKQSRHITASSNILWNCGKVTTQTSITAAAGVMDGSPTGLVDNAYTVGQAGAAHSITVTSSAGFAVGDTVTLHQQWGTSAQVAANPKLVALTAPLYTDGTAVTRRIVAIPDSTHISIDRPLGVDFTLEVNTNGSGALAPGSTVYGKVTKGRSLHVSVAIAGPNGVICGVAQPPRVYTPRPVDDWDSVYRFSWDMYQQWQLFRPEVFEVFVTSGVFRTAQYTQK